MRKTIPFKIREIFALGRGKEKAPKQVLDGSFNMVIESQDNNGVIANRAPSVVFDGNKISVSVNFARNVFYQPEPFGASVNILTLSSPYLNEQNALYLCSVLRKKHKCYDYNMKISRDRLADEEIHLPFLTEYRPDWAAITELSLSLSSPEEWDAIMSKIDTSQWQPFSYQDIFTLQTVSTKLTKLDLEDDGNVPVYSSDSKNNGCIGYCNKEPHFKVSSETPLYVLFGDHTRTMNIVTRDFCVKDNVKVLIPKIQDVDALLFVITSWKKAIPNLGYARHWGVAKDSSILLPATEVAVPDWDYMAERIQEMEVERIQEMEAYLNASGLDNTELSKGEKKVLEEFNELLETTPNRFSSFSLEQLFNKVTIRKLPYKAGDLSKEPFSDSVPVLTASNENQGLTRYIATSKLQDGDVLSNKIAVIANGDCTAFYQSDPFVVLQDAYALDFKHGELDKETALYLTGCLQKLLCASFDWNNKAGWNKIKELEILLPVTDEGTIDFEYMRIFEGGVIKETISQVSKWRACQIETAMNIIR